MAIRECDKHDVKWLTALMLDAEIFAACTEDGTKRHKMVEYVKTMLARPDIVVITPAVGKAIISFVRQTGVMWDIHIAVREDSGIPPAELVRMSIQSVEWMVTRRGAKCIVAHIPEHNRAACIHAVRCGLVRVGVISSAMVSGGKLVSAVVYQTKDESINQILAGGIQCQS